MKPRALPRAAGTHETAAVSDAELMTRLAEGDMGALGELYDRHQTSLRRFVTSATSHAEDVDDLVHATFLAAAKSAERYDGRALCRPWLMGIAAQLLRRRRQSLGRLFAVLAALRITREEAADPRARLSARSDVQRGLLRLSEPKRITLLLAEVEGLSCEEIAVALDIPVGTVWTRLHAARRELRKMLHGGPNP